MRIMALEGAPAPPLAGALAGFERGFLYPLGALLAGWMSPGFQEKMLAFVAGDFLYIGAGDLLPEAHRRFNWKVILLVLVGMVCMFALKLLFP